MGISQKMTQIGHLSDTGDPEMKIYSANIFTYIDSSISNGIFLSRWALILLKPVIDSAIYFWSPKITLIGKTFYQCICMVNVLLFYMVAMYLLNFRFWNSIN